MHDEGLQPSPQSYKFTPQQHYHQDYGYNLHFYSACREDFLSNLIGIDLLTLENIHAKYVHIFVCILSPNYYRQFFNKNIDRYVNS
ncbi:hypothetical protein HKD37_15G043073 [Glycine soja]